MFQVQLTDGSVVVVPTDTEHAGPEAVDAYIRDAHAAAGLLPAYLQNRARASAYQAALATGATPEQARAAADAATAPAKAGEE